MCLHDLMMIEHEAAIFGLNINHRKTELICEEPSCSELLFFFLHLISVGSNVMIPWYWVPLLVNLILSILPLYTRWMLWKSLYLDCIIWTDMMPCSYSDIPLPSLRSLYTLWTAPCLQIFADELRSILSTVLNIILDSETAWCQATLPVGFGGIVIQSSI